MNKEYTYIDDYATPTLVIEKEYDDIITCIEESQEEIYRRIIDLFDQIIDPEKDKMILSILAKAENMPFHTNYEINKSTSKMFLIDSILPYFLNIEEYEICDRVVKMNQRINR